MNDDEELDTFLLDNNPANLLPYSKRLIPEDPDTVTLPKGFIPSEPSPYGGDNYV
jgi:hypothetical protein